MIYVQNVKWQVEPRVLTSVKTKQNELCAGYTIKRRDCQPVSRLLGDRKWENFPRFGYLRPFSAHGSENVKNGHIIHLVKWLISYVKMFQL